MKIVLLGTGNVAVHLGPSLKKAGHRFLQVYGRNERSARSLSKKLDCPFATDLGLLQPKADVYLLAVRDEAIPELLPFLPATEALILHTSGSVPLDVLRNFKNTGVLYPLQTLSIHRKIKISAVPFCLEVNRPALKQRLTKLIKPASSNLHWIDSDQRRILHLAAVFANNFSNHLFSISEDLLNENGMDFGLLKPLILETGKKVQTHSPRDMQTGPARRGDSETIEKHLALLSGHPQYAQLYQLLTESIREMNGPRL